METYTLTSASLWRLQYILINETGTASVRRGEAIIRAERALEEVRQCLSGLSGLSDLSDAERRKNAEWVELARCLASRLEDEIDISMLPYGGHLPLPVFLQLEIGQCSFLKLVKKVEQLCRDAKPTGTPVHPNVRSPTFAKRRGSSASEITMIGMDDVLKHIGSLVDSRSHPIIIWGHSGCGKTMLARSFYDTAAAKHGFDLQSWVDANEVKEKTDLLRAVLRGFYYFVSGDSLNDQITVQLPQKINSMDDFEASESIKMICHGKKYLIVLNDVDDVVWNVINNTLFSPSNSANRAHLLRSAGSVGKVILTTRNQNLGGTHALEQPYKVPPLTEQDALMLLQSVAVSSVGDMPSELKERVKEMNYVEAENEILEMCERNRFAASLLWRILLPLDKPSPRQVCKELRSKLDQMHKIEKKILQRCIVNRELNPLAIRTLGGQLRTKPITVEAWQGVLDGLNEEDPGGCSENLGGSLQTDRFIISGYSDLPPLLKFCFLYCSMFPDNYDIPKKKLIRLWIAEGFVQDTPGKTEEEAAEHQLNQLIDREMIVVSKRGLDCEVVSCKVLRLIRRVALDICKQQGFCRFVPNISSDYNATPDMGELPGPSRNRSGSHCTFRSHLARFRKEATIGCRRVTVHEKADEVPLILTSDIRLRSLLFFGTGKVHHLLKNNVFHIACSYTLLRVLELQGVQLSCLPEALKYLALLRYLGLRRTGLSKLPKSLSRLKFLKSMDTRDTDVSEIANVFGLRNLRHLHLASSFRNRSVLVSSGLLWLVNLQTLAGIAYTELLQKDLWRLTKIRKLSIKNVVFGSSIELCNSINRMLLLESLTITSKDDEKFDMTTLYDRQAPFNNMRKLKLGGRMIGLLDRVSRIHSIAYLYLWDNKLEADPLKALQGLPHLVLLSLYNAYDGKELSCNDRKGYTKLKKLSVICLDNLEACTIETMAMQNLEKLFFGMCKNLKTPPTAIKQLPSLCLLQLSEVPEQFGKKIRENGFLNGRCKLSTTPRFHRA